jgi:hypothetical protein
MSFSEEHFCPANQIVKGRHGKKIRRNLFKFSFNQRTANATFPVMIEISATTTATIFPVDARRFPLVDGDCLHPDNTRNVLDSEVIGIEQGFKFKSQCEKIAIRFGDH